LFSTLHTHSILQVRAYRKQEIR